jgi:DNA-binding PadR family transcriptional regulator
MLQLLEDEGLAKGGEADGRRTYELTDEGRAEAERRSAGGPGRWAADDPAAPGQLALRESVGQLHAAARQVASAGSPDQVERATEALRQARQALYTILAES